MRRTRPIADRFWSKVDRSAGPDACWPWTASRVSKGYGRFALTGRAAGWVGAHRMAYILTFGDVPEGLLVLHGCDNPPCCNPAHLHPGTNRENAVEASERGLMHFGEANGAARLTAEMVVAIRAARADEGATHDELARRLSVSRATVTDVLSGRTWRNTR